MTEPFSATILIVDDLEANRYTTGRILRQAGYHVVEAGTGDEALREVRNGPDLVILDVNLPDMNGLEISRILRLNPATRSIPVLQMSATYTLSTDKAKGLDAGADSYLAAPVSPEELLAQVRTLLRLRRAQDELQQRVKELETIRQELAEARDQLARQNELLESRVRERTAQLQASIQELEIFSYSITHDMRAPLRAMQGFSNLLLASYGTQLGPEGNDYLQRVANSAQRLDLLIRDVLTYSNVSKSELELVRVDLDKLVRDIIREYPGFQPPQAQIDLPEPLPRVLGNEAFLTQCVANLLDNSVKFVAPHCRPHVIISTEPRGGWVRLNVKDNGIGIPPQHQGQVFKLFHRAQSDYSGTGVGLAVVSKAVERMGGKVGFVSAPGEGSTFWVELRLAGG